MSSYFYIYQGGAIASKLMVLDDVTGGNCWNAGLYIYLQSSIWVEHIDEGRGDSDWFPIVFKEANTDE